jgi:hypothetical protein
LGLPLAVLLAAAALPVAAAQAAPAPGAPDGTPPQPSSSPCANPQPVTAQSGQPASVPYDPVSAPLALPNWSDGGGWTNASQYATIMTGDIDGDGIGELLGRNGDTVESWTVAPPERPAGQPPFIGAAAGLNPAAPNQWVTKVSVNPPPPGTSPNEPYVPEGSTNAQLSTSLSGQTGPVAGFSDPSRYTTFRLANLDGVPGDELIVRSPSFSTSAGTALPLYSGTYLTIYKYQNGAWTRPTPTVGLQDLVGGNWKLGPQATNASQGLIGTPWFLPQYYTDITTGDIDGDGKDEIIARGADGLHEWYWGGDGMYEITDTTNAVNPGDPPARMFPDNQHFDQPAAYNTLRVADFDGDGQAEVAIWDPGWYAGAGGGLIMAKWQPGTQPGVKSGSWGWGAWYTGWNTGAGWGPASGPANTPNLTLSVGNLDGDTGVDANGKSHPRMDLFAQTTSAGLTAIKLDPTTNAWVSMTSGSTPLPATTPATDWTQPQYYATLQAGDVTGSSADEVIVRGADGLHTFTLNAGGSFQEILKPIPPPQTNPPSPPPPPALFSDAAGWADPSKYSTIKTAFVTKGNKRAVIGRDKTGIRTVFAPQSGQGGYFAPSTSYPAWAGGTDPTSHGDGTPAGQVYQYVNDQIAYKMNWAPVPVNPNDLVPDTAPTIRSKFVTGSGVSNWFDIATNIEILQPPVAMNVDRDTFNAVQREMADWARDVGVLWAMFFASASGQSLEQLMLTALVVGDVGNPVSDIEQQFNPSNNDRLWAAIADLVWGVISGITIEGDLAEDATKEVADAMKKMNNQIKFAQSVVAAGAAAAITSFAPNDANGAKQGQEEVTADQVNQHLVATFCTGISFLYGSADQTATDLGLLTAMGEIIRDQPVEPTYQYPDMVTQLTNQRTVWVYQQFASMATNGVGWQMNYADADKASKIASPSTAVGNQVYAPGGLGSSCTDGHASGPMTNLINQQSVSEFTLAQPTWAYWDANGNSHNVGDPHTSKMDGDTTPKMGTGGWRLPARSGSCS